MLCTTVDFKGGIEDVFFFGVFLHSAKQRVVHEPVRSQELGVFGKLLEYLLPLLLL